MSTSVYIATAYRWGWTNTGAYIVWADTSEAATVNAAQSECYGRGGKYGVEVRKHTEDDSESVAYFPSTYGESAPRFNRRIATAEHVGLAVMRAVEDGDAKVPQWIVEEFRREEKLQTVLDEASETGATP